MTHKIPDCTIGKSDAELVKLRNELNDKHRDFSSKMASKRRAARLDGNVKAGQTANFYETKLIVIEEKLRQVIREQNRRETGS